MTIDPEKVRAANRKFYDAVADVYEEVDGRRTAEKPPWLLDILADLAQKAPDGPFLEIGCGTGWLLEGATHFFSSCYGTDLAPRILPHAAKRCQGCVASLAESLAFTDKSFAAVALFATMHHLPQWRPVIEEACRVLKPGGWLYTDHDIDSVFLRNFRWPLSIYRGIRQAHRHYQEACPEIDDELYFLSEIHENSGVVGADLKKMLETTGFDTIILQWHWLGVHPVFDLVGRVVGVRRTAGLAPNLRILARKKVGSQVFPASGQ